MKTKSRAVRRNSCGYALLDDVSVSGGAAVDDSRSPTPVSEGFVSGVSVLLDADSVPGDAMIEGDGFGCSVDMAGSLGSCRGHSAVVDAPLRMPMDTNKAIYVRVYRKWTATNKESKPFMFSCILIDQQPFLYLAI